MFFSQVIVGLTGGLATILNIKGSGPPVIKYQSSSNNSVKNTVFRLNSSVFITGQSNGKVTFWGFDATTQCIIDYGPTQSFQIHNPNPGFALNRFTLFRFKAIGIADYILSTGGDQYVKIIPFDSSPVLTYPLSAPSLNHVTCVVALYYPSFATGHLGGEIHIWNKLTWEVSTIPMIHGSDRINDLIFHHWGTIISAAANEKTIKFWSMNTLSLIDTINLSGGASAVKLLMLPSGLKFVAAFSNKKIALFEYSSKELEYIDPSSSHTIVDLMYIPTAYLLLAANTNGKIYVWNYDQNDEAEFKGGINLGSKDITSLSYLFYYSKCYSKFCFTDITNEQFQFNKQIEQLFLWMAVHVI